MSAADVTLYHETTRQPVALQRLLRDDVVVRRYMKPERTEAGVIIPATARTDGTQTLWEVVASGEGADAALGTPLRPGDILQTQRRWPRDLHLVTQDGAHALLLSIADCGIRSVIRYDEA